MEHSIVYCLEKKTLFRYAENDLQMIRIFYIVLKTVVAVDCLVV